jgi:glutamine amidotransferase
MIVIVDYGRGNLFSLSKALDQIGARHCISDQAAVVHRADALILPGVGAFGDSMAALQARDLVAPLRDAVWAGTPLLGICLGMQILATAGDEFGRHEGLGFVPGLVQRLPAPQASDPEAVRIPNVGWRRLESCRADAMTQKLSDGEMMYFIHSFGMVVEDANNVVATVRVNGLDVPAIVRQGAICGCQFHPERSGEGGLALLARFVNQGDAGLSRPQNKSNRRKLS